MRHFDLSEGELELKVQKGLRIVVNGSKRVVRGAMDCSVQFDETTYLAIECKQKDPLDGIYQCVGYLMENNNQEKVRENRFKFN